MVVMKNQVKEATQKKNKFKSKLENSGGQTIIVIDDDDDDEVKPKVKKKKKKRRKLEQEKATGEVVTKRKKKDSKLKKGCADHPLTGSNSDLRSLKEAEKIIIVSSSDSESIKETRKAPKISKKKRDQGSCHEQGRTVEVPNEDLPEAHQEISSLSRKTCKRTVLVSHGDDQNFAPKKKKKRKRQPSCEDSENKTTKPFSKKTKLSCQEGELLSEPKRDLTLLNATRNSGVVKKKHKGIRNSASVDSQGSSNGIGSDGHARADGRLKQEPGCQERALGCGQQHENGVENVMTPKKMKKKKKAKDAASVQADHHGGDSENLDATSIEDSTSLTLDTGGRHRKKKKKMQAQVENGCPAHVEVSRGMPPCGKEAVVKKIKKKKAKKAKEVQDHGDHCGFVEEMGELHSRKVKRRESDGSREQPSWKKVKVETEAKEEEEIQVVAIKKGNCDEVSIDKLRRQALQDEIDRESGKTKAVKEEGESDAHFGQWGTATFESSERKNKFLRLLGGFKKGSAPAYGSPVSTTKPNMALAKAGERHLLQNLQAEFDKARDLKQFKGTGLGFQPPAQKHAFIDKYASKSIKFEN